MDALFALSEVERSNSLHYLMQYFRATYVCLWLYTPPPSNCFIFFDGFYQEDTKDLQQPSSSVGSLARRLFDEYRGESLVVADNRVPGLAYKNNSPYIEIKKLGLLRMASIDAQRQFYQAARIQAAVFMGCRSGEIEIGWSNVTQMNTQNEMRNWFPYDFSRQSPMTELSQIAEPSWNSSSSSSLICFSMDSPDTSSLLFNIPPSRQDTPQSQSLPITTSPLQEAIQSFHPTPSGAASFPLLQELLSSQETNQSWQQTPRTSTSPFLQAMVSLQSSKATTSPLQQYIQPASQILQQAMPSSRSTPTQIAMQQFALARNVRLPTPEIEEATMASAILAVLTSAASSSSTTHSLAPESQGGQSAFKNYRSGLAPTAAPRKASLRRQSMLKRAISYYRRLNIARREQLQIGRPTVNQLHHMISERKRRGKINDSFQALRAFLPPETKKDKASVLTRTREYLASLVAQIEELNRINQQLEARVSKVSGEGSVEPPRERVGVQLTHVSESTSERRVVDLQVTVRGDSPLTDVVIRILEFLKQVKDVSVEAVQANTHRAETSSFSRIILRLNIEGNEWDESGFEEAVRRAIQHLAQ